MSADEGIALAEVLADWLAEHPEHAHAVAGQLAQRAGWSIAPWAYVDEPQGACPVQACGTVHGPHGRQRWYFRARRGAWSLDVGPTRGEHGYVPDETAVWSAEGDDETGGHGDYWREGGPDRVVPPLIAEVLGLYLSGHPGGNVGLTMRRRD